MYALRHIGPLFTAFGFAVFIGFSLGCMNLGLGGPTEVVTPMVVEKGVQRGKSFAPYAQEMTVYYPQPYVSPPNLEFEDEGKSQLIIIDQKPDCFRVKNTHVGREFMWKARGVLATSARAPAYHGTVQATFGSPQTPRN